MASERLLMFEMSVWLDAGCRKARKHPFLSAYGAPVTGPQWLPQYDQEPSITGSAVTILDIEQINQKI